MENLMIISLIALAISIVFIAGLWKTFQKAGEPGWAAIVPIYNFIIILKMAGKPVWWLFAFIGIALASSLFPGNIAIALICNIVLLAFSAIIYHSISLKFGKGVGMTILLMLGIGWLILGFGDAQWQGDTADMNEPDILHS
ncbi:MAG: signal peptidase I [Bacteroidia bacterium]|nr:signal peptidase I [Bacteroidia bacterium]